jgi:hypothetical protein
MAWLPLLSALRLCLSKGNDSEENPREIQREKLQHYGEVTSFAAKGVSLSFFAMGVIGSAAIAIAGMLYVVLGILWNMFSAF